MLGLGGQIAIGFCKFLKAGFKPAIVCNGNERHRPNLHIGAGAEARIAPHGGDTSNPLRSGHDVTAVTLFRKKEIMAVSSSPVAGREASARRGRLHDSSPCHHGR